MVISAAIRCSSEGDSGIHPPRTIVIPAISIPIRDEMNPYIIFKKKFLSRALKYPTPNSRTIPRTFERFSACSTFCITKNGRTTINPAPAESMKVPRMIVIASRDDIFSLASIYAALFCCIAWGIADGLFYVWERRYIIGQENEIIRLSKSTRENESALPLVGEELDDTILRNIAPENRQQLYQKLLQFLSGVTVVMTSSKSPGAFRRTLVNVMAIITPYMTSAPAQYLPI
jgi:hypothetical protein